MKESVGLWANASVGARKSRQAAGGRDINPPQNSNDGSLHAVWQRPPSHRPTSSGARLPPLLPSPLPLSCPSLLPSPAPLSLFPPSRGPLVQTGSSFPQRGPPNPPQLLQLQGGLQTRHTPGETRSSGCQGSKGRVCFQDSGTNKQTGTRRLQDILTLMGPIRGAWSGLNLQQQDHRVIH